MIGTDRFIRTIKLENILSYSRAEAEIQLESLNVLIGRNATGKSNLIEALSILNATPKDLIAPIREGGGVSEWINKGPKGNTIAGINATIFCPDQHIPLRYRLSFTQVGQRFELVDEAVESEHKKTPDEEDVYFFYRYEHGNPVLNVQMVSSDSSETEKERTFRSLRREDLDVDQSVLSQRKDPDQYPELTYLANHFSRMKFYREWNLGRYTPPRLPQQADLPEDFLLEDASNLGLVLNNLQHKPGIKGIILKKLKSFYGSIEDITTKIQGGTVQIFLHESGLKQPIPATRLSDGTLRYICLLVILCHPEPPKVICIEEPELGLHPDILPTIADLLIEASHRTQLIVTTHSDVLVSALTDVPQSVIICEHDGEGTQLFRLEKGKLEKWLEKYSLGELWRMGEIGGV